MCLPTFSNILGTASEPTDAKPPQRGSAGLGLPETLSTGAIDIIKATTPAVAPKVADITKTFYHNMFKAHPELFALFNKSNQAAGRQPRALAASICAYATHIDNLGPLVVPRGPVDIIAHKHCGLGVLPEQYPIVHDFLMAAIGEVLGDVVTPEIGSAWSESVLFLAKVLIDREEELYVEAENKEGGWRGLQDMKVVAIKDVATDTKEFTFSNEDGKKYDFTAGQFMSVKIDPNGDGLISPRHYTITSAPGAPHLQCTVKRLPGGVVSEHLHDKVKVGDTLQVHPPFGVFTPREDSEKVVLLSAGVGITPMINFSRAFGDKVALAVHVDRNQAATAFSFDNLACPKNFVFNDEHGGQPHIDDLVSQTLAAVGDDVSTHFYVCGPPTFMDTAIAQLKAKGVTNVFSEAFGPELAR